MEGNHVVLHYQYRFSAHFPLGPNSCNSTDAY